MLTIGSAELQVISTAFECTIQPLSPFSQTVPAHSMYLYACANSSVLAQGVKISSIRT